MAQRGSSRSSETLPQPGKVNGIVQEWLLKEDGALAQRLQTEEIVQHYERNRYRNGVLRDDVPHVRQQQLLEDAMSAGSWVQQQQQLFQQTAADASAARQLLAAEMMAAAEQRRQQEEEDARLARQLSDREKHLRRQHRERKQVDEEARMLGLECSVASLSVRPVDTGASAAAVAACSAPGAPNYADSDLSDLMAPPPDGELLSEEDYRSWQEQQDEEVAILLQEQDVKRRGDLIPREKQVAIEAQDRELAKVLQEQERARIRRAKQRAREKRRQRREQQELQMMPEYENQCGAAIVQMRAGSPLSDSSLSGIDRQERGAVNPGSSLSGIDRQERGAGIPVSPASRLCNLDCGDSRDVSSPAGHNDACCRLPVPESVPPDVDNIATVIDPTYRRQMTKDSTGSQASPHSQSRRVGESAVRKRDHSPATCHDSGAGVLAPGHPPRHGNFYRIEEGEPEFVPPYMPLQGQRRSPVPSIAEQRMRNYKRGKDQGCKQQ